MGLLGENRYGKSAVRLVKLDRGGDRHQLRDVTVAIALEGEFEACHVQGDNRTVLPTDTMKNTVYALARDALAGSIEAFGSALGKHFLGVRSKDGKPLTEHVSRARIEVRENIWQRLSFDGTEHPHAFARAGSEQRVATVLRSREEEQVESGIDELLVLKTTDSGFENYIVDSFTTLPPTADRIFATVIQARWRYATVPGDYDRVYDTVRTALLRTFAFHKSLSVQHTLYDMAEAVLGEVTEIGEVHLTLPNRHHLPVDVTRFGLENRNDIFVATTEPYGLIEATVRRS